MINFDQAVLKACQDAFGEAVIFTPPGGPAWAPTRGIWTYRTIETVLDDGSRMTTATITLGIRASEYPVIPAQGFDMKLVRTGAHYVVDHRDPDGQGGIVLTMKARTPIQVTG